MVGEGKLCRTEKASKASLPSGCLFPLMKLSFLEDSFELSGRI